MDVRLLKFSVELIVLIYGTLAISIELLSYKIPPFLVLIASLVTFFTYFRAAPQSTENLTKILGEDLETASSDDENLIKVVAHRGASLDAPENTLEAFKYCIGKGCKAIELDVSISKDGVPVVFHDKSTGKMCGEDLSINRTDYLKLRTLNLSEKHRKIQEFPETHMPTLEEAISFLLDNNVKIFIDVKEKNEKIVDAVIKIFANYQKLHTESLVTSFYPSILYKIRRKNPRIVTALSYCPKSFFYSSGLAKVEGHFWMKTALKFFDFSLAWLLSRILQPFIGFSMILIHRYSLDAEKMYNWSLKGVRMMAWTVNNPIEKKYCLEILKIPVLTDTLDDDPSNEIELDPDVDYYDK